jgi:hypothetical protein
MSSVSWARADVKTYTYAFGATHPTPPACSDLNSLLPVPHRSPLLLAPLRATPPLIPWHCSPSDAGAPTLVPRPYSGAPTLTRTAPPLLLPAGPDSSTSARTLLASSQSVVLPHSRPSRICAEPHASSHLALPPHGWPGLLCAGPEAELRRLGRLSPALLPLCLSSSLSPSSSVASMVLSPSSSFVYFMALLNHCMMLVLDLCTDGAILGTELTNKSLVWD